jgi:hypothetical protein
LTPLNFHIYIYGALYEPIEPEKFGFEPPNWVFWLVEGLICIYIKVKRRNQYFPLSIVPVDNVRVQKVSFAHFDAAKSDEGNFRKLTN